MNKNVIQNKYGFYELALKPTSTELEEYYSKKYYQDNKGSYEVKYSTEELNYFNNKIGEKYWVINKLTGNPENNKTLLDIGCGEGFTLKYFKDKGWGITGIDYSDFACKTFNPDCIPSLLTGDIYQNMIPLIESSIKYDVVWLDNVLEHVLDPLHLLKQCKKLLNANGVLVIEVPNDFSVLQQYLLEKQYINSDFWVVIPDHISYFSKDGLTRIANEAGLKIELTISDNPIDFNLLNPDANYNKDKTKGKNAHHARIELDNLMHTISIEKTVNYFKALAELGLGRQLISFLRHS
jgi:2-polyprenyl-3-methyl-5-hydroxy-6-metoxy-1,4-benzoquinol methylase